ncbi:MAG: dTDP-4-dehydrorhamnose reductase [Actinomycetota bacterium]
MTTVLLTGGAGQVGKEIQRAPWAAGVRLVAPSRSEVDLTDAAAVHAAVAEAEPDVIVNCAAYTRVDDAEDEPDAAMALNASAVAALAEAADAVDALLVHLSTDYVFDGAKPEPYVETDPVNPLGVYGRSKVAGEEAAATARRSVTLRTSWLYGALGANFVATMLRLAGERDEIGVVDDQHGCPTAAADLAVAIGTVIDRALGSGSGSAADGPTLAPLYHLAAPDEASWYELAVAAFDASALGFGGVCRPLTTAEYPTRARRPRNSRLDCSAIARDLGVVLPSWRRSLPTVVAELEEQHREFEPD